MTEKVCIWIGITRLDDRGIFKSRRARAGRNKYKILMFKCLKRGKHRQKGWRNVPNIYKIRFAFGRMENLVLSPGINALELIWVSAIVLTVSVFASFWPAYKASKMEPVDALRHV